jgi:hypothetical protein
MVIFIRPLKERDNEGINCRKEDKSKEENV